MSLISWNALAAGEAATFVTTHTQLRADIRQAASILDGKAPARAVLITGEAGNGKSLLARCLGEIGRERLRGELLTASSPVEAKRLLRAKSVDVAIIENIDAWPHGLQARIVGSFGGRQRPLILTARLDDDESISTLGLTPSLFRMAMPFHVHIPCLRRRAMDVGAIARQILGGEQRLAEAALALLSAQAWPGNGRDLRLAVLGAGKLALADNATHVTKEHLEAALEASDAKASPLHAVLVAESGLVRDAMEGGSLRETTRLVEAALITRALRESGGNVSMAGRRLRTPHSTLKSRILALQAEVDAVGYWMA